MMNFITRLIPVVCICFLISCKHKSDIPRPDHVIVVIEENHGYDQLIGSKIATFLNQLADSGALFMDSHGVIHPSQPNYLAIFSGSLQGIDGDECLEKKTPYTTPNLGAALINNGFTFKGYAQTMPSAGFTGCSYTISELTGSYLYARKHAPWVNWQGDKKNNFPAALSLPMTGFPQNYDELPTVAFVIPDQDHDMHNIGDPGDSAAIHRGDQWLQDNLGAYAAWAKTHNSLLIVTFDEDDFTTGNRIATIFYGATVKPGKYGERINHYSVLHTLEAMYGLPVADSTGAAEIKDVWKK
jgi:phosphatidylinositol-3-phosphatase